MINIIDQHLNEVADLCRNTGARRLDAFGSVVRNDFDPAKSDVEMSMHVDARKLLWDAQQAAERISRFTTDKAFADYEADEYLRSAVERQFEIALRNQHRPCEHSSFRTPT